MHSRRYPRSTLPPLSLTGLDKTETVEKHGPDQVLIWRRSYATPPPPMPADHEFHPRKEAKYKDLSDDVLPVTESLACVVKVLNPKPETRNPKYETRS